MLKNLKFHHIGIAVHDIDVTARYYQDAGYARTDTVYDPVQNVNICFLSKDGMPLLELIAPVDDTSPVCSILDRSGVTPYHNCYEAEDIAVAVSELKKKRFIPLSKPVAANAMNDRKICFMFNKDVGLIELVETAV